MSTDAGLGRSVLSEETPMGADIIGKLTGSVLLFFACCFTAVYAEKRQ